MEPQDFFDKLNILAYRKGTENNFLFKIARTLVSQLANFVLPIYLKYAKDNKNDRRECVQVIVSLTSYPARINQVSYTVKTLKRQSVLPKKIILWLSKEQFPNDLFDVPEKLANELDELFEIRFIEKDLRPHKKYFYSFKEFSDEIIVTVDDDVFYNSKLIETLILSYKKHPNCVICNRGLRIMKDISYSKWERIRIEDGPSFTIIPTGVGGVLYPPHIYDEHIFDIKAIELTCLRADDLWINFMCRYKGSMVVTTGMNIEPITITKSQKTALCKTNNGMMNENDLQLNNISKWAAKNLRVDYFYNIN